MSKMSNIACKQSHNALTRTHNITTLQFLLLNSMFDDKYRSCLMTNVFSKSDFLCEPFRLLCQFYVELLVAKWLLKPKIYIKLKALSPVFASEQC